MNESKPTLREEFDYLSKNFPDNVALNFLSEIFISLIEKVEDLECKLSTAQDEINELEFAVNDLKDDVRHLDKQSHTHY